jgi:hypothetical protein
MTAATASMLQTLLEISAPEHIRSVPAAVQSHTFGVITFSDK